MKKYERWLNNCQFEDRDYLNKNIRKYKQLVYDKSVHETAQDYGIIIGSKFSYQLKKILYKYPHKGDFLLIKYLINFGFFDNRLFPKCELCGQLGNSRTHVTNECKYFEDAGKTTLEKIEEIIGARWIEHSSMLEEWILRIYFCPGINSNDKTMRILVETIRSFASHLYTARPKKKRLFEMSC